MDTVKNLLAANIEKDAELLHGIAKAMYDNPELGNVEFFAAEQLVNALKKAGYEVEQPFLGVETGFKAVLDTGKPGPQIALLSEYDALPGIGHGCGHNLIGVMSLAAARALASIRDQLCGKIVFFGCPAEETNGAKVVYAEKGAFADIDAALQVHPGSRNTVGGSSLAIEPLQFTFHGKTAHASGAPEEGINALDAAIQTFNGVNALRQHVKSDVRIHGIIKEGGLAANIVPEKAVAQFYVRAAERDYLNDVVEKVKACARAGAAMAGATLEIVTFEYPNDNLINNSIMSQLFVEQLLLLGIKSEEVDYLSGGRGSTDVGNVSHKTATIHPHISITGGVRVTGHSREMAEATISEHGKQGTLLAGKALAFCCWDLINDPGLLERVKEEFNTK